MAGSQAMFAVFNQLSKHESELRSEAAQQLLSETSKGQDELKYALKRLVRGLSSSRAAARQGFALGLCTVLRDGKTESLESILDDVETETKLTKKERGEEERDKLIGRAFGYLTLLQSGALDASLRTRVLEGAVSLAKEKTWLKDVCTKIACMVIEQSSKKELSSLEETLRVGEMLVDGPERKESDIAVAITLEAARGKYDLLTSERLKELAKPLASAWRADPVRLHIVWEALSRFCAPLGLGRELWVEVAEPALLKGGIVSPERKCAGFLVFGRLASDLATCNRAAEIPEYLLSRSVLSNMLVHAKSKKMVLNEPARLALSQMVAALTGKGVSDEDRLKACKGLLEYGDFDGRSGTRTVHDLLSSLSKENAAKYMKEVEADLPNPRAVHALAELVRAHPGEAAMEQRLLELMFEKGFFTLPKEAPEKKKKEKKDSDDDEEEDEEDAEEQRQLMQRRCRQRVFTLLKKRLKSDHEGTAFSSTLDALHKLFSKRTKKLKEWDAPEEVREAFKEVESSWTWLSESDKTPANEKLFNHFEVLLKFLGVVLYLPTDVEQGEEEEEFSRVDVVAVASKLGKAARSLCLIALEGEDASKKKPSKKSSKKKGAEEEEEHEPILVVVECMLSLLVQPSTLLRELVSSAAKPSAQFMAESKPAMEALMEALSTPQQEEIAGEDEEEVEMDPEESDEEDDAALEDASKNKKSTSKVHKEASSDDEEDESEEEGEGVDDIEAYDRALGEFLRQRRESTQKSRQRALKQAQRESDAFKLRVLDLLEAIFARHASESRTLAGETVPTLLRKVASTKETTAAIFSRIQAMLLRYFKNARLEHKLDNLSELIQESGKLAERAKSRGTARLSLEALAFYIKLGRREKSDLEATKTLVSDAVRPLIVKALQGHSSSTFLDADALCDVFFARFPELGWTLLRPLSEIAPRTPFQRLEQVKMLSRLLRSQKESISDSELKDLRSIALDKLEKEYEHVAAGKGKAALRIKDCLAFVKQVRAFGKDDKFEEQLEALFEKIARETSSIKVRQMVAGMSSRKAQLEALLRTVPLKVGGPLGSQEEADEDEEEAAEDKSDDEVVRKSKKVKRVKTDSGAFFKEAEEDKKTKGSDKEVDEVDEDAARAFAAKENKKKRKDKKRSKAVADDDDAEEPQSKKGHSKKAKHG